MKIDHEFQFNKLSYQLKTAQDLFCFNELRNFENLIIGEIGGGDSRILSSLTSKNSCYNIEKFEGVGLGPRSEVVIKNVTNINAYVGEFDISLKSNFFDVIFSISVVEHIIEEHLNDFFLDSLRILKKGGFFIHAIDFYINDNPSQYWINRFELYKKWIYNTDHVKYKKIISDNLLNFNTSFATNPDNILYSWNTLAPNLKETRELSQSVSLVIAGFKI